MTAKIKLNAASGGGSFSLQAPSSSSNNRVFTLPDSADATLLTSTSSVGKVLQYKVSKKTNTTSTSSGSYGEISSDFRITLTPTASDSTIVVTAYLFINNNANANTFRIRRNTASDFSGTSSEVIQPDEFSANEDGIATCSDQQVFMHIVPITAYETSGDTTARTYSPFWRVGGGTGYLNSYENGDYMGVSTMTVMEISA